MDRTTIFTRNSRHRTFPIVPGEIIYAGALVGIDDSGVARNAIPTTTFVGIAVEDCRNLKSSISEENYVIVESTVIEMFTFEDFKESDLELIGVRKYACVAEQSKIGIAIDSNNTNVIGRIFQIDWDTGSVWIHIDS